MLLRCSRKNRQQFNNLTLTQCNDNKIGNCVLVVYIEFAFLTWTTLLCIAKIVCSVKCSKHREDRIRHRICEFYFIICFALIMIKNVYEIQVVSISKLDKYECVGRFGYYDSFFFRLVLIFNEVDYLYRQFIFSVLSSLNSISK